jgi:hypothetical protein
MKKTTSKPSLPEASKLKSPAMKGGMKMGKEMKGGMKMGKPMKGGYKKSC